MSEIESKVKEIIVDKLGVDEAEVKPEASFTNDLGADSLDTVELIMEFEKEFGISIPDDKAEKIGTVGDAIAYIEENKKINHICDGLLGVGCWRTFWWPMFNTHSVIGHH